VPHDARAHEWSFGNTRIGSLLLETSRRRLGKDVRLVARHMVNDGIQAVRKLLPLCESAGPCTEGIKALRNYRKESVSEACGKTTHGMTLPATAPTPSGLLL
jgi:hypothetical protein